MTNIKVSCCAHCGGQSKVDRNVHRRTVSSFRVFCTVCGISTRHYASYTEAVKAWNRRPDDVLPEGLKAVYDHNKDESDNRFEFVNRDIK